MKPTDLSWITSDFAGAVADGAEVGGVRVVERIKSEIATAYPPASTAGTPPHRRSGNLQAQTRHGVVTEVNGGVVTLTISNDALYGGYLRDGTSRMDARDFMGEAAADRYVDMVVDAIVGEITSRFS